MCSCCLQWAVHACQAAAGCCEGDNGLISVELLLGWQVRELVAFLRKRDKRVAAHAVEEAKRREEAQARERER